MESLKVLKWPIIELGHPVQVPGRRVVFFASQHGQICVWTECYANIPLIEHIKIDLVVVGTGFPFHEPMQHLMSCQDRSFVWHLYQKVG